MSPSKFQVFDASNADQRREWLDIWGSWRNHEVFAYPGYVELYAKPGTRALCACLMKDQSYILYPFLFRDISLEPYCPPDVLPATDIVTPYGYGGAFAWGEGLDDSTVNDFWGWFGEWANDQHVVSEFMRLSLFPGETAAFPGTLVQKQFNVVCDLQQEEAALWMGFDHKVRKNVNRAKSLGVAIEQDDSGQLLEEFLRIYRGTMERRNAGAGYNFPREYFESLHLCNGLFRYFHAVYEGKVVSSELVLVSADKVYSFLGGTDKEMFRLRSNDLLKYEIINWARGEGKRWLVLGGGYLADDGIYRYKLGFAPHGSVPFFVGQRVLRVAAYEGLLRGRNALAESRGESLSPTEGFFPAYRG